MNTADIVIICILLAAVAAATVYIVKRRKKGKCIGCSGNCASCAVSSKNKKR
ncbi:MAG: FeoB-associated Cys-rich membrane protein [Ruminococcus sp.]|nr:FeoB-associated Cys-rich membrane protein [Ruminococcus sp.]MDY3895885.1 FeoB-associated Cys-rich membrane protein [Candidatus Fimenecus sp.]